MKKGLLMAFRRRLVRFDIITPHRSSRLFELPF
jgi:hypothetical protein